MDVPLVEGRSCGECNVCCVALTIQTPELKKPQGYRCKHLTACGCGIYETRYPICRTFYCGWRTFKWVKQSLRPDTSQVLVRFHPPSPKDADQRWGVTFSLLSGAALKAEGLAESVSAAVAANLPVFLHVPGAPGRMASQAQIDEALFPAVQARDKAAVLEVLRVARKMGLAGQTGAVANLPVVPD